MPYIDIVQSAKDRGEQKSNARPTGQWLQDAIGSHTHFDIAGSATTSGAESHDSTLLGLFGLGRTQPNDQNGGHHLYNCD